MNECMDGWGREWMDKRMDGCAWMKGCIDEWIHEQLNEWMDV